MKKVTLITSFYFLVAVAVAQISGPTNVTQGQSATYNVTVLSSNPTWTISPNYLFQGQGTYQITVNWNTIGTYTISFYDGPGLVDQHTVTVASSSPGGGSVWSESGSSIYYNSGNVGIGTSGPSYKLDVNGTTRISGTLRVADNEVQEVKGIQMKDWDDNSGGTNNKYRILARDGAFQFYNGGVVVGSYGNGTWSDLADGSLVVENNLAIGKTSVSSGYKLDVSGAINASGNIKAGGKAITSRKGIAGTYNSNLVQGIWSIGDGYGVSTSNNDFGSQYGIVYAHTNAGTSGTKKPIAGWGHQILFTSNGTRNAAISLTSGHGYFKGNVGIGTTSPTSGYKLDVNGKMLVRDDISGKSVNADYSNLYKFGGIYFTWDSDSYGTNTHHSIRSTDGNTYSDDLTMNSYGNLRFNFDSNSNGNNVFTIGHATTGIGNILFSLNESGELSLPGVLAIGSPSLPSSPTGVMYVNGSAYFTDINVQADGTWPDYVFGKNYKLKSLEETEQFIEENHHLPDVPSAKEVEENGIDVAQMNKILLQKIEELTLHLIEQSKKIETLQSEVDELKNN